MVFTGRVNGVTIKSNFYVLTVVSNKKKYHLLIKPRVIAKVFGSDNLPDIQNKSVVVKLPKLPLDDGSGTLIAEVTQSSQINVVP